MIDRYLAELERLLEVPDGSGVVAEVKDHLKTAAESYEAEGFSPRDAERHALETFGDVHAVAAALAEEEVLDMRAPLGLAQFAGVAALVAILAGAVAADSLARRMSTDVIPSLITLGLLALVLVGARLRFAGRIGLAGWLLALVTLASAIPILDWDGTAPGASLALAGPSVAFAALAVGLHRSHAVPAPVLLALGSLGIAAAVAIIGVVAGADMGLLTMMLLVPFGAGLLWLGSHLWEERSPGRPGVGSASEARA
jgi:hypothetical protein